jgi:thiol-disulfide isomerase/thioredoxin
LAERGEVDVSMIRQIARRPAAAAGVMIAASGLLFAQSAPKPSAPPGAPGLAHVQPVDFGGAFPAAKFANLNGAAGQPATIDLATYLGKKPIVFVYWMVGNARSEKILLDTQAAVDKFGSDKVALLPIAAPVYGSTDVSPIKARAAALKLKAPVLHDEGFRLLQELEVHAVPNIAIVDAGGKLRMSNGGSLTQSLEYKLDVEGAIHRLAATGQIGTYGTLPTYYPVTELVGKKCPDFDAPLIDDAAARSFSSMLSSDKLNVLIFWSVDCPHCKASLPKLNDWLKGHPAGMNVISAARITDDATKARTAEYCKISGFLFPTFVDKDMQIGSTFQVISTPTVLVIRPDGVVDSVLLSSETDLGAALEAKKREILKAPAPKG